MAEQLPRLWWDPNMAAAYPGSILSGLRYRYESDKGYVKPPDITEDAVELRPIATAVAKLRALVQAAEADLCCRGRDGWGTCGQQCATALERYSALTEALEIVEVGSTDD